MLLIPARWRQGNGNVTSGLGPCLTSQRIRDSEGVGAGRDFARLQGLQKCWAMLIKAAKRREGCFMSCIAAEEELGIQIFSMKPPARVKDGGQCPAGGCPRALPLLSVCTWLSRPRRSGSCHRGRGKDIAPAAHVPRMMPFITAREAASSPAR
ncbi:hypothetical protein HJG60_010756 [Phyllostomus discolor]|uniref:Uncharacterized protein n=1 Tax=Phyllostomus discolor TaxID=89673 RepID=A0A834EA34_9CHIR|nr:hypothetical protein HJG60_010756 [Phyllostomus discolor]